ncbi:holo-ACP synthase [Desertihabitans aurantiacus]|uniref:holo-ACP synthase n=1 Tax=Desertihabitans aurantiacus TaxID=2282477 RepID=UPI000DF7ADE4|nr:holo-ACP synthase [Desertihabitans aurantiacus]
MIVGVGVDLCEIARFDAAERRHPALTSRCLTPREAGLSLASRAGRFAAKEALAKALFAPGGLSWHDAEVVADANGAPSFLLRGTVLARAQALGITRTHLSISHDAGHAVAMVVCEA